MNNNSNESMRLEHQSSDIKSPHVMYHMRSVKFYCQNCRRDFSALNPENNHGACPRCGNVSTTLTHGRSPLLQQREARDQHDQTRAGEGHDNQSGQEGQNSNSQPRSQFSVITQAVFRPIQGLIAQGLSSITGDSSRPRPQAEPQPQPQPEQSHHLRHLVFSGVSRLLGFGQPSNVLMEALDTLLDFDPQQNQARRLPGNPSDLFGEDNSESQAGEHPQLSGEPQEPRTIVMGLGPFQVMFMPVRQTIFIPGGPTIDYERLIEEFLRSDPNNHGPAPASQDNISRLKEFDYQPGACQNVDCTICQEDYKGGDKLVSLPCGHNYHKNCVTEWLARHDSCPICRKPISGGNPPNAEASNSRQQQQQPQPQPQQQQSTGNPFAWFL